MLYDEEGNAYIEHPLIPEEQHLMYIVKDYRRMYSENIKLTNKVKKLAETNTRINSRDFHLYKKVQKHAEALRHAVNYMKKSGVTPSTWLEKYMKDNLI